jgi:Flp pilus assembly protein TadD
LAVGKGPDAIAALLRAVELDPGSAPRRGNLGTVLLLQGRVDEAIVEYRAQVQITPEDARGHSDLGTALLAKNDAKAALPELERAIALDATRATFRSNRGRALDLLGRRDDALADYRAATKMDPQLISAWINLGTLLSRDPSTRAEARAALKRAEAIDRTDPRVKANLEELDALERGIKLQ